jgi:hypothetical protein
MSFWFYRRDGKGRRKLYSAEISIVIMILTILVCILLAIIIPRFLHRS